MRLLRITGNSIYKRLRAFAAILGCCDTFWKDSVIWDDTCEWEEPTCDGAVWVNTDVWNNECAWPWEGVLNQAPIIFGIPDQTDNEGDSIYFPLTGYASDPDGDPLTYSLVGGTLPSGLVLDNTGLISGNITYDAANTYNNITIQVADNGAPPLTNTDAFDWVVNNINRAPVFTNIPNTGDVEGTLIDPYNIAQYVSDLDGDILTFTASGLPTGLLMESTGRITGTIDFGTVPDSPYNVTVYAVDNGVPPLTGTTGFEWTVTVQPLTIAYDADFNEISGISGNVPDTWNDEFGEDIHYLTIGSTAEVIGSNAFLLETTLSGELKIPSTLKNISVGAFDQISLNSLVIETGVTGIGFVAFRQKIGQESITGDIYVPSGVIDVGQAAFQRLDLVDSVYVDAENLGITSFEYGGFDALTLGPNVKNIGVGAFRYCDNLTGVTIGENVEYIDDQAFFNSTNNGSITYVDNQSTKLTGIGNQAFYEQEMDYFDFNEGLIEIGGAAFRGIIPMTGVYLPDSLKTIDGFAFYESRSATGLRIGTGVTSIGNNAFGLFGANKTKLNVTINCPTGAWNYNGGVNASFYQSKSGIYTVTGAYYQDYTGSNWSGLNGVAAGSTFISGTY